MEMRVMSERTGGLLILSDSFVSKVFTESFRKLIGSRDPAHIDMAFSASLEASCSREMRVIRLSCCCTESSGM